METHASRKPVEIQDCPVMLDIMDSDSVRLQTPYSNRRHLSIGQGQTILGAGEKISREGDEILGQGETILSKGQPKRGCGSKLLLALPLFAFIIPVLFVFGAYFHACNSGTLKLPSSRTVPYISDIGNSRPQSGIFTLGLTFSSYFTFGIVIVRFFQIKIFVSTINQWINCIGLLLGMLIVAGKILVASFQLSGHFAAHFTGASMYLLSTVVFITLQTYFSFKEKSIGGRFRKLFLVARSVLCAGSIIGTLVFGTFLLPPLLKYNGAGFSIAQTGEWCFAVCKMLFMLTFIVDFWNLNPRFLLYPLHQQTLE